MPPEEVVVRPSGGAVEDWVPELDTPRNSYTPYYAPDLRPAPGQVAVFPRGASLALVAAIALPPSTRDEREERDDREGREGKEGAGDEPEEEVRADTVVTWPRLPARPEPVRSGLFLLTENGALTASAVRTRNPEGGLLVRAPAGRYWTSLEIWDPPEKRAGRLRRGIIVDPLPPDVVTLSDLLLLEGRSGQPERLEDALPHVLPRATLPPGEVVTVAWELHGLGWTSETVQFSLAVVPAGGGIFDSIGDWFGGGDDDPLRVSWAEPAPEDPGPWFRTNGLELRNLEPGDYEIVLRVRLEGREVMTAARSIRVSDGG